MHNIGFIIRHITHNTSRKNFTPFISVVLFSLLVANVITTSSANGARLEINTTAKSGVVQNARIDFAIHQSTSQRWLFENVLVSCGQSIVNMYPNIMVFTAQNMLAGAVIASTNAEKALEKLRHRQLTERPAETDTKDLPITLPGALGGVTNRMLEFNHSIFLVEQQNLQMLTAQNSFAHMLFLLKDIIKVKLYLARNEDIENIQYFSVLQKKGLLSITILQQNVV